MTYLYHAQDEQATDRLGQALAQHLPPSSTIALVGTLGAGKTRLVQAVATALEVPTAEVTSPTFVLINEYVGRVPVAHFDAYRLADDDEFLELGPEEYFARPGLTFIEWADRVKDCLPPEHLRIEVEVLSETARQFRLTSDDETLTAVVQQIAAVLA